MHEILVPTFRSAKSRTHPQIRRPTQIVDHFAVSKEEFIVKFQGRKGIMNWAYPQPLQQHSIESPAHYLCTAVQQPEQFGSTRTPQYLRAITINTGQEAIRSVHNSLNNLNTDSILWYAMLAAALFSMAGVLGKHVLDTRREARVARLCEACEKGIAGIVEDGQRSRLVMIFKVVENISA
ncbi:hypothetical protein BST61_g10055 [Cercospora zeina]